MKILIADDDPITLDTLSACIEMEGFQPLCAGDGREAIALWRDQEPSLICLDIMMPEIDGFEVCRRIRKSDPEVPILFLSAKNQEIDIVAGLDLGADDFIRKPFTRPIVMARIRAALRRGGSNNQEKSFSFGNLTVFPDQLAADKDGEMLDLTPREVSMLSLLYQHQGQPVSRDAFLDTCWGVDYFPDSRTLDQHIFLLRKKVELDPGSPQLIQTVRAVGYRYPLLS